MDTVSLKMAITVDVMLGRWMSEPIAERGFEYPWGDVLSHLRQVALLLVNLECALPAHTRKWRDDMAKPFHFRADPSAVEVLQTAGVYFASLASPYSSANASCLPVTGSRETVQHPRPPSRRLSGHPSVERPSTGNPASRTRQRGACPY